MTFVHSADRIKNKLFRKLLSKKYSFLTVLQMAYLLSDGILKGRFLAKLLKKAVFYTAGKNEEERT